MEKRRNRVQPDQSLDNEDDKSPKDAEYEKKETRVGKRLNESTQRRVIMMVLAMLFSVPILSISTYY
jgi:hypothetical protein